MSNDEPDTVGDFHRSHNSLLGEGVGIRQFHDQERVARMAAAAAALAKPVARRHTIGRLPGNTSVLTGPLVPAPKQPGQNPAQAVTPKIFPSTKSANTSKSRAAGLPDWYRSLLHEEEMRLDELTKPLLGKSVPELTEMLGSRDIKNAEDLARQGPHVVAGVLDLLEGIEKYGSWSPKDIRARISGAVGSSEWPYPPTRMLDGGHRK
ncbi:MAG: hypothetical protein HN377_13285 [Alphaproteobacteria bacterium]|jgi:hypothetical protein|nr:hypothetical protein [Alphaproteobacteria bacterium]